MEFLSPSSLKKGDKAVIIAPAKRVSERELEPATRLLESWGLKVGFGKNIFKAANLFSGLDHERAADLQEAIDDKEAKVIFCARGGYGVTRIIDAIDFTKLIENPKWIVGFSDITALLLHIYNKNVETVHGPMPFQYGDGRYNQSAESVRRLLFGSDYRIAAPPHPLNVHGSAEAPVIGGNLSMICNIIGTASDVDFSGKLLLLEDIEEYLYRLDRMMVQLKRTGKLSNLAGVLVGRMTNMLDNDTPFGKSANEIIFEQLRHLKIPVCFNFPSGHEPQNMAVPFGRKAKLTIDARGAELRF